MKNIMTIQRLRAVMMLGVIFAVDTALQAVPALSSPVVPVAGTSSSLTPSRTRVVLEPVSMDPVPLPIDDPAVALAKKRAAEADKALKEREKEVAQLKRAYEDAWEVFKPEVVDPYAKFSSVRPLKPAKIMPSYDSDASYFINLSLEDLLVIPVTAPDKQFVVKPGGTIRRKREQNQQYMVMNCAQSEADADRRFSLGLGSKNNNSSFVYLGDPACKIEKSLYPSSGLEKTVPRQWSTLKEEADFFADQQVKNLLAEDKSAAEDAALAVAAAVEDAQKKKDAQKAAEDAAFKALARAVAEEDAKKKKDAQKAAEDSQEEDLR